MKRLLMFLEVMLLMSVVLNSAEASRIWNRQEIRDSRNGIFNCGYMPTMALLYGVQPVISSYNGKVGYSSRIIRKTAFGWNDYALAAGFVAGDGYDNIQSYVNPLDFGQDGEFYSTDYLNSYGPPLHPITLGGGSGPTWTYSTNGPAFVDADPNGTMYMAMGNTVAQNLGTSWSQPVTMNWSTTLDLAVSKYGDIALTGTNGSEASVAWYDYKCGAWSTRRLCLGVNGPYKIDAEWDENGNLGVAYLDGQVRAIKFDYMDTKTSSLTSELVGADQCSGFAGTALAYDRFGNPVIASGSVLFYDPIITSEPSSLLALAVGGLVLIRRRKS